MPLPSRLPLRLAALAATALLLAGCGGSDADTESNSVGVLTDSPVQGVEVVNVTRPGLSGLTGPGGRFEYRPGDMMIFEIGELPIGVVTGTGSGMTVTPLQLIEGMTLIPAGQRENAVTNVLVLLQSLDEDGNPDNGITIPAAAHAALAVPAVASALHADLGSAPATFAALPEFVSLFSGLGKTPVSAATALAHFKAQFLESLAGTYAGTAGSTVLAFRFRADGAYVMAEIDTPAGGGKPGVERGVIDWNPANGRIGATTPALDTNDNWGLSDIDTVNQPLQLAVDNGDLLLILRNAAGAETARYRLRRVTNSSTGIAGPWVRSGNAGDLAAQQYLFLSGGAYLLMDASGDDSGTGCGGYGVELGRWRAEAGILYLATPDIGGIDVDTNGCDGGHDTTTGDGLIAVAALNSGAGLLQVGPVSGGMTLRRPDNSAP